MLVAMRGKLVFGVVPGDIVEEFRGKCRALFPRASAFMTNEEKAAKREVPPPPSGEIADKCVNGTEEPFPADKLSGDSQTTVPEKAKLQNELCSKTGKTLENGNMDVRESIETA